MENKSLFKFGSTFVHHDGHGKYEFYCDRCNALRGTAIECEGHVATQAYLCTQQKIATQWPCDTCAVNKSYLR